MVSVSATLSDWHSTDGILIQVSFEPVRDLNMSGSINNNLHESCDSVRNLECC